MQTLTLLQWLQRLQRLPCLWLSTGQHSLHYLGRRHWLHQVLCSACDSLRGITSALFSLQYRRAAFLCNGEPAAAIHEHQYSRGQPVSGGQPPVQHTSGELPLGQRPKSVCLSLCISGTRSRCLLLAHPEDVQETSCRFRMALRVCRYQ